MPVIVNKLSLSYTSMEVKCSVYVLPVRSEYLPRLLIYYRQNTIQFDSFDCSRFAYSDEYYGATADIICIIINKNLFSTEPEGKQADNRYD
jgi:hypothetical protein